MVLGLLCLSAAILALGGLTAIPMASELREPEIYNGDFGVLQRYSYRENK